MFGDSIFSDNLETELESDGKRKKCKKKQLNLV